MSHSEAHAYIAERIKQKAPSGGLGGKTRTAVSAE
jgi:hypothetical protein